MATIISRPGRDDPSSEDKVASALASLSDEWTIIHSVPWTGRKGRMVGCGEADFVLVHESRGFIVLEVKGGGIEHRSGKWYSTDRYGEEHEIQNPFDQAAASRVQFIEHLRKVTHLRFIPAGHAVAFPDITCSEGLGLEAPQDIVLDREILQDINKALDAVLAHWQLKPCLDRDVTQKIIDALEPTVSVRRLLSDDAREADAELVSLTQQQIQVLDAARRVPRAIIFGGAGTGKTLLACERARQLRDAGHSVLFTCYNRLLANQLQADHSLSGVTVNNFHGVCVENARKAGLTIPEHPDHTWWQEDAPMLLLSAAEKLKLQFDAVVVDEGQDFAADWIDALKSLCRAQADSPFYIFADENQKLWDRDWKPGEKDIPLELTRNCRNTHPIAERVAAVAGMELQDLGTDGPEVMWTNLKNKDETPNAVRQVVSKLLGEGFGTKDIVVLIESAPRAELVQGLDVGDTWFCTLSDEDDGIVAETIGRFKGLEALAVVVVLDREPPPPPDRAAYVGFSRARTYLHVIASEERIRPLKQH